MGVCFSKWKRSSSWISWGVLCRKLLSYFFPPILELVGQAHLCWSTYNSFLEGIFLLAPIYSSCTSFLFYYIQNLNNTLFLSVFFGDVIFWTIFQWCMSSTNYTTYDPFTIFFKGHFFHVSNNLQSLKKKKTRRIVGVNQCYVANNSSTS